MQACKAYYSEGRFVPFEPLEIPEGSHAIVTILDFSISEVQKADKMSDKCSQQLKALERFREGVRNCDEQVPDFERIKLREADI